MEQIEKQFITSLQSNLAQEGKEICEKVELLYGNNDEFIKGKAYTCSRFIESHSLKDDLELYKRCLKYMDKVHDFNRYESTLKAIKDERKKIWI